MEKPIDRMMRQVKWVALPPTMGEVDLPYATHEGVLDIGGFQLHVHQLNTGQRVIDADDLRRFFDEEAPHA